MRNLKGKRMMGKEDSKIVRPAFTAAFKETRDIAAYAF